MSTPNPPPSELPNTYVVQDRSAGTELTRVHLQDQLLTAGMGGVLPEQPDPTIFHSVLDVGCGTGDWLLQAARAYAGMSRLVGVDASSQVVAYARALAEQQQVTDRVTFHVMDALRMLEFPANTFDLVNQRLGMSYLRTWDWPKLFYEYQRVARRGGTIRITESDLNENTSPALTRLFHLFLDTLYQAGHFFTPQKKSVIEAIGPLLQQYGFQDVQTRTHALHFRGGTPEGERFCEDMKQTFRLVVPFLEKWIRLPDDYEAIYQQALKEMERPDFEATLTLLTAWGTNPPKKKNANLRGM